MQSQFGAITDDFIEELDAIASLISEESAPASSVRVRIAAANAATLLLAATFEEFIRQMAREFARSIVQGADTIDKLPSRLLGTAWKRTVSSLGRLELSDESIITGQFLSTAHTQFTKFHEFARGDLTQDIYGELIHNEHNMQPRQLNELFNICDLKDVCMRCAQRKSLQEYFGEVEPHLTRQKFATALTEFMKRRNEIAHELKPLHSKSSSQVQSDIEMFKSFANSLLETLESEANGFCGPIDSRPLGGM